MDHIIELADRLGKAIADSEQATALRLARKSATDEPGLDETMSEYQASSQKMAQLQAENKPIEVEDKHKLQALQEKVMASEAMKKLTAAQVEYIDLMRKVGAAMQSHLAETEQQ